MRNILFGLFFCTQAVAVLAQDYKVSVLKQALPPRRRQPLPSAS